MSNNTAPKPKNVGYCRVPCPLWWQIRKVFPKDSKKRGPERPPADNRDALNGIWYVLWTGCHKKVENWLAFIQFACAHILMDMVIYG